MRLSTLFTFTGLLALSVAMPTQPLTSRTEAVDSNIPIKRQYSAGNSRPQAADVDNIPTKRQYSAGNSRPQAADADNIPTKRQYSAGNSRPQAADADNIPTI
ncbi:hypothetical protein J3E72DRAFT_387900 [Bipolaris maydis]|nr:hypothetical protein BM1_10419 [Bipolaris maydis]KAJ5058011.1 hypothetical protein J3E74DRAFT_409480 [Bipolaris maydis]KAJ6195256.1 hypothetical protein J3E72DRAFT_387900 [Bipolaris maydis]